MNKKKRISKSEQERMNEENPNQVRAITNCREQMKKNESESTNEKK